MEPLLVIVLAVVGAVALLLLAFKLLLMWLFPKRKAEKTEKTESQFGPVYVE